jgi:hypothetical protein
MVVLQQKSGVIQFSTPNSALKDVFGRVNAKRKGNQLTPDVIGTGFKAFFYPRVTSGRQC